MLEKIKLGDKSFSDYSKDDFKRLTEQVLEDRVGTSREMALLAGKVIVGSGYPHQVHIVFSADLECEMAYHALLAVEGKTPFETIYIDPLFATLPGDEQAAGTTGPFPAGPDHPGVFSKTRASQSLHYFTLTPNGPNSKSVESLPHFSGVFREIVSIVLGSNDSVDFHLPSQLTAMRLNGHSEKLRDETPPAMPSVQEEATTHGYREPAITVSMRAREAHASGLCNGVPSVFKPGNALAGATAEQAGRFALRWLKGRMPFSAVLSKLRSDENASGVNDRQRAMHSQAKVFGKPLNFYTQEDFEQVTDAAVLHGVGNCCDRCLVAARVIANQAFAQRVELLVFVGEEGTDLDHAFLLIHDAAGRRFCIDPLMDALSTSEQQRFTGRRWLASASESPSAFFQPHGVDHLFGMRWDDGKPALIPFPLIDGLKRLQIPARIMFDPDLGARFRTT